MLLEYIFLLTVISAVSCQINGEFWWLNKDVTNLKHGIVSPPKFDDVNEFDTDETAKVIFRDNHESEFTEKPYLKEKISRMNNDKSTNAIYFQDETKLSKPLSNFIGLNAINDTITFLEDPINNINEKTNVSHKNEDELRFVFPGDENLLWTDNTIVNNKTELFMSNSKVDFLRKTKPMPIQTTHNGIPPSGKDSKHPKNACRFMERLECIRNEGYVYISPKTDLQEPTSNKHTICCILPTTTIPSSKIIFPESSWNKKRKKRSNVDELNPALKQRNTLMSRKYLDRVGATTPGTRNKVTPKIVNSNEYSADPYWNIKNPNIRNPDTPLYQDPDAVDDYGSQNYGDIYASELPKPGLIGLYSDHRQTQTSWTHNKNKGFYYDTSDSIEEEIETSFGYSSIDPRLDRHSTSVSSKPNRHKPSKFNGQSPTNLMTPQSQTISFHSNPDFHVLEGFKLLNLVRHKNRFVRKTPEGDCDKIGSKIKEKPTKDINYPNNEYEDESLELNLKQKLQNECGKTVNIAGDCENGREQGVVEFGNHPWIAMVVSTKSQQNLLCYATLVHARVAVTAADCVYGKSNGAISVIAGVRNLNEDLIESQRRMATIFLDAEYTPGDLQYNLGLLHWKRALILDATVQPVCLGDTRAADVCVFVGWGGFDQEMQSDLRWQRASILAPQNCNKHLSKLQVSRAICAAVESRGTVTGVGGPLMCKNRERWSMVGVAMWRDEVVILLPPDQWVIKSMGSLIQ